jgi:hypothetical protein
MICNGDVVVSCIASLVEGLSTFGIFVYREIEGISCGDGDVLVSWGVVDTVLSDKFKTSIILILLKHSNNTFWEWNTQAICF